MTRASENACTSLHARPGSRARSCSPGCVRWGSRWTVTWRPSIRATSVVYGLPCRSSSAGPASKCPRRCVVAGSSGRRHPRCKRRQSLLVGHNRDRRRLHSERQPGRRNRRHRHSLRLHPGPSPGRRPRGSRCSGPACRCASASSASLRKQENARTPAVVPRKPVRRKRGGDPRSRKRVPADARPWAT